MKLRHAIVAAAFGLICAPALALPVTLSGIVAVWEFAVPPSINASITGPGSLTTVRWGTGVPNAADQSGYNFSVVTGGTAAFDVPPDSPATLLGTFDHLNFPIQGTTLNTIQLKVTADVNVNGTDEGLRDFVFNFQHFETPNSDDPCQFGGSPGVGDNAPTGCRDKVVVSFNNSSENFIVGGVEYTLDILGFSKDNGATIATEFLTTEGQENNADLFARVRTTTVQVPEPASLALIGLGMLAAGFVRRRSSR
ncbi:MAG: THxN family PEP-CTERM protein [Terriglobia bacterium]